MLYQKIRPTELKDICGNDATVASITDMLEQSPSNRPHSFLLCGPSGCGKTTLARIMAVKMGCEELGIEELNAANTRGIDSIRLIAQNAAIKPLTGKAKCYILDESHQLTSAAQQALLKVIEDVPEHCYFFFCTTEPQNLIKTIKNRCTTYQVEFLGRKGIVKILQSALEKIEATKPLDHLEAIAAVCEGSPRAALVLLEQILFIEDEETIIEILSRGTKEDSNVWELVNLLCSAPKNRKKKFKRALEIHKTLDADSEQVRRTILSCLLQKLESCDVEEDTRDYVELIKIFSQSTYYGGKAQLGGEIVQACFVE
jgi:DNA polymerase III gamma/tau subunit